MGPFAAFAGIVTGAAGMFGAGEQNTIDKESVQLTYQDNLEKIRRRGFEQNKVQGAAQAFSQNSGVRHSAGYTAQGFLDTMSYEFKKELDWMKKYAEKARDLGMEQASVDYSTNRMNAISSGMNAASSVMSMG